MKPVIVVGAGFSGLTLAYRLRQQGLPVQVVERAARAGGLISTTVTFGGLVESAANALLANSEVEDFFRALGLEPVLRFPARHKRYIFWDRPRRWPALGFVTGVKALTFLGLKKIGFSAVRPRPHETVRGWARRVVNARFEERLLAPALQGIYAGDIGRMSASLVLAPFFERQRRAGEWTGSVAPAGGMGELIDKLSLSLRDDGVEIQYGADFVLTRDSSQPVVLCTSAWSAEKILRPCWPQTADILKQCESLPLISVTAFFPPAPGNVDGFGCLFPHSQKFHALGVLFNSSTFSGRSELRSETWIFGGAQNPELLELDQPQLVALLLQDRHRLQRARPMEAVQEPLSVHVTRWPRALPHYTVDWEILLPKLNVPPPLFLHGNYLGRLGLAQILQRSTQLATTIKGLYGN